MAHDEARRGSDPAQQVAARETEARREMDALWAGVIERVPKAEAFLADPNRRAAVEAAAHNWRACEGYIGREWRRAELVGESGRDGFVQRVERHSEDILDLAESAQSIAGAFRHAKDDALSAAAEAVLLQFLRVLKEYEDLMIVLQRFQDAIPAQGGGPGKITAQSRRKAFPAFAEIVRDLWMQAGLSLGGNGKSDDGFGDFLLAVYNAWSGESRKQLPNGAKLLAALRDDWPRPKTG